MGRSAPENRNAFIGYEEWVKELQKYDAPEGFTTAEYMDLAGVGHNTAADRIRRGVRLGVLMFVGHKTGKGIDGRTIHSPVYRPVKVEKKKSPRRR